MTKTVARKTEARLHKAPAKHDGLTMVESYLPAGSPQRTAAEIAAAAGGALIAAALLGVGPTALAGAAGYLVYRETHRA
jgi:hypothetical protein